MENYKEQIDSLAEEMLTVLYDSAEWAISDADVDGDEFNAIHAFVMKQTIKKMLDISTGIKTYNKI